MNRWLFIRRLRWPSFLILFGITALLNQWRVLSFSRSWPLYIILAGLMLLAERAALPSDPPPAIPAPPFPGRPYGWSSSQPSPSGLEDKPARENGGA